MADVMNCNVVLVIIVAIKYGLNIEAQGVKYEHTNINIVLYRTMKYGSMSFSIFLYYAYEFMSRIIVVFFFI